MPSFNEFFSAIFQSIGDFLQSSEWNSFINTARPIAYALCLLLLVFDIYMAFRGLWVKENILDDYKDMTRKVPVAFKDQSLRRWSRVDRALSSKKEERRKLGIIEGVDIVKTILEKMGCEGESLQELIMGINIVNYPNVGELQTLSEYYNNVLQDPDYTFDEKEGEAVKEILERFLKNFNYI